MAESLGLSPLYLSPPTAFSFRPSQSRSHPQRQYKSASTTSSSSSTSSSRSSSPSSIRSLQSLNSILSSSPPMSSSAFPQPHKQQQDRHFCLRHQPSNLSIISIAPPSPTRSSIMEPDAEAEAQAAEEEAEEGEEWRSGVMEPAPVPSLFEVQWGTLVARRGSGNGRGMYGIGEVLFG